MENENEKHNCLKKVLVIKKLKGKICEQKYIVVGYDDKSIIHFNSQFTDQLRYC